MIVIHIELWPFGQESQKRHLGTAKIWNDGTGTKTRGNYRFTLSKKGMPKSIWKTGEIKDFPRKAKNAWDLFYRVLKVAVYERNRTAEEASDKKDIAHFDKINRCPGSNA